MWLRRFKPTPNRLRVTGLVILSFGLVFLILSSVFPFPEGTWDFLSIGTSQKALADPGWLSGWAYRCNVTIDADDIDADLTWFPVCLKLGTSVGINSDDVSFIFDEIGSNYKKIAITPYGNTTELYAEVEAWNSTAETAVVWVSRDGWVADDTIDTTLSFYYDNDHADNTDYVGDVGERPEVWDSYHQAVFHMSEDPSGTAPQIINSVAAKAVPVVASGVNEWLIGAPYNRNIWYANGRWWIFYANSTSGIYYKSATTIENLPYATATAISSYSIPGGYACDFVVSGTTLQYIARDGTTEDLRYRKGTLESGGTITWDAAEQTIDVSAYGIVPIQDICITADSNGYAWIAWAHTTSSSPMKGKVWVRKNANSDGTWSTDGSVGTKQIGVEYESATGQPCWPTLVPLTSGKMYAIAQSCGKTGGLYYATGDLWSGSAWLGTQETITAHYTFEASVSAVGVSDDVHMTYGAWDTGYGDYGSTYYRKRTSGVGWGSETEIKTTNPSQACLGKDSSGDLYCFWANGTYGQTPALTDIYYKKCTSGSWGSAVNWHTSRESIGSAHIGIMTCSYAEQNSSLVLAYITGDDYPDSPRYGKLWLADVLATGYMNAPYATSGGSMTTTDLVAGQIGKCLDLDGANDYLYAQDSPDVGDADFTLEGWSSRASSGTVDYILAKVSASNTRGYGLDFYSNNYLYGCLWENYPTLAGVCVPSASTVTDSTWRHLAVAQDRSGNGQIYINGAANGSPTAISSNDDTLDNSSYLFIGNLGLGPTLPPTESYWFHGKLDELRISRTLRSAAWLSATYEAGIDNLVYWGTQESAPIAEIANTPDTKAFGILTVNSTSDTGINYFTLNNTGNCAVDVVIYGTDLTGGDDTWDLSDTASPGENIYGLKAGIATTNNSVEYPAAADSWAVAPDEDTAQLVWVDPTNAEGDDAAYASVTVPQFDAGTISQRLRVQDFGFSIPDVTILGIKVEIERYNDAGETAKDYRVQLLDANGDLVGTNKADTVSAWDTSPTIKSYGGASDTWSASPTASMVNDADFGVVLSAQAIDDNADIYVDFIRVTVYYASGDFTIIVKEVGSTPYNYLVEDLAESGTQDWGLELYMPTSLNGYDASEMTATITLVASEAA